jgi:RNA polymerase sigma-70 factor, ECF subfamily
VFDSGDETAQQATDEELVRRHRAGEREAFGELISRYTPAVYNLIYRFTGNRAESENLTQETWLRLWLALPRILLDRPLKPYLLRIAFNLCRTWAAKARVHRLDLDINEAQDWLTEDGLDIVERLSETELRERVQAAIDKLPPLYRAVMTLRYSEDLSYEEISQALNLPLNTVRTYLRRAKARLRELLSKDSLPDRTEADGGVPGPKAGPGAGSPGVFRLEPE